MSKRLSVIVSQAQGKNPVKRKLEEDVVAGLLFESGIDVTIVPNLYDIQAGSTSVLALNGINGNAVLCSWLFERAARWVLDRHGVHGQHGTVLLQAEEADDEDDSLEEEPADDKDRVIDARELPNRKIYCLDFKASTSADQFIAEIKRIHAENAVQVVGLGDVINAAPIPATPNTNEKGSVDSAGAETDPGSAPAVVNRIDDASGRRWYPVIDYSRCTNCMECIDFCLFGVYGIDRIDTILVEEPDNCRKGCPACSRVCPENAIMFPQHKTPAIAGSMDANASLKIDLSQLFGAPADGKSAAEIAALERDEQLVMAGRDAVGVPDATDRASRSASRAAAANGSAKDELDDLVDQLNDLDL